MALEAAKSKIRCSLRKMMFLDKSKGVDCVYNGLDFFNAMICKTMYVRSDTLTPFTLRCKSTTYDRMSV